MKRRRRWDRSARAPGDGRVKPGTISRERWIRLEPLLDAALELDPSARLAFAHEACARDASLRADLQALLFACEQGSDILSTPASEAFAPLLVDTPHAAPTQLGRYKLVREIGRGGMATVYLADDPKHTRQVAVKVLHAHLARLIGHERFLREIEIAARLSHPHILPLHDSGDATDERSLSDDASILFFVSPFVSGESLRDLLKREKRMRVEDVVRLGGEIAMALEYAHRQGVIHLDIKPGNILLQEGHAVITDFGIARAMSNVGDERAGTSILLGTPAYMSPEQAAGVPDIDGRSDIYSLGCVLNEMCGGEPHSPELAAVIQCAMSPSRADRFATAGDLAGALAASVRRQETRVTRHRRAIGAALLVSITAIAVMAVSRRDHSANAAAAELAPISPKSIAVLPFVNVSPDSGEDYFSDGLTRDLIAVLTKSADMRVVAPASAFRFRNQQIDVRDVAHQLRVAYLLRGTVQKSGNTVRLTTELIKAADGTTVWSDQYDRTLAGIFAIQDEIAANAVKALQTTLLANALTANTKSRNAEAYNLVLRARHLVMQPKQEGLERAVELYHRALVVEPRNAAAYAGLARAYRVQAGQDWIPVVEGYALGREAAQRAITLDPELADGYEALAWVQSTYDWDWSAAEANYHRALELEPGNAEVLRSAALLMSRLGRYDDAIIGLTKAVERDPLAGAYSSLSYVLCAAGRWEEAEAAARTALALGPGTILRHFNLARALLFQGKTDEALREVQAEVGENWRLMGLSVVNHALHRKADSDSALKEYETRFASHSAMQIAEVHAYRGEVDAAFTWLDRAYVQHDPGIADLLNDPWLARVRGDPRYALLLTKLHLSK